MSFGENVRSALSWCYRFVRNAVLFFQAKNRFIVLTPPFFARQLVYDRQQRRVIALEIRDIVDSYVVGQIYGDHDYALENARRSEELLQCYRRIVASGKTPLIVDCGGNSGMATRYFCETFKEAFVVCIEPDGDNLSLARRNNDTNRVRFVLAGVGSTEGKANIVDPGDGNWGYRIEAGEVGSTEIISINSVLEAFDSKAFEPFIIKIDIEGFESNLFEKNTEWIDRFPLLSIELHDWMLPGQANSRNFLKAISARDRDFVFSGENVFSVSNTLPRSSV